MERGHHIIAEGDREGRDQIPKRGSGAGNRNLMTSQEKTKPKQADPVKLKPRILTLPGHGTCKWACPSSCFAFPTNQNNLPQ